MVCATRISCKRFNRISANAAVIIVVLTPSNEKGRFVRNQDAIPLYTVDDSYRCTCRTPASALQFDPEIVFVRQPKLSPLKRGLLNAVPYFLTSAIKFPAEHRHGQHHSVWCERPRALRSVVRLF